MTPYDTRVARLSGGLRVVTQHDPTARSVAVGAWVGVGNRDEAPALAGASHFLEHLLFKGSSRTSARDIAEGIDAVGGDLNAFTSKEYTAFHARVPAKDLDFGLGTLLEVLADPGFTDADVDAERQVILEELAWSADTPDDVVHQNLAVGLFPDHSLGWEVLGSAESVGGMRADDVRAFHDRWYRRANLVIAVVGNVDHEDICARVDQGLQAVEAGEVPAREAPSGSVEPSRHVRRNIEQAHVAMGWRGLDQFDDDRFALAVANQLIGGGWSSRLFQEVREKRGMSYSVFSSMGSYVDSGTFSVYGGVSPRRRDEFCEVVELELDDLMANGPGEREMDIARGGFEGGTVLALEDAGSRMAQLATNLLVRDRVVTVPEYLEKVRAVTADDVHRVLAKVLSGTQVRSVVEPR
ncbi:MAG: pitrilysin family protein [Acidimicrobiales bacterium]